jgi:hypothetical protein
MGQSLMEASRDLSVLYDFVKIIDCEKKAQIRIRMSNAIKTLEVMCCSRAYVPSADGETSRMLSTKESVMMERIRIVKIG